MKYLKISENVEVDHILEELEKAPHLWDRDAERTFSTSPHRETHDIWVRYNPKEDFLVTHKDTPFDSEWYEAVQYLPSVADFCFRLMAGVNGEDLGGVLVTKVPAGKKVYMHTDEGWHVDFYDKFYLHLESNDKVVFGWESGEEIQPQKGDLYWLDNTTPHYVNNDGDTDRITLIVCIKPFIRMRDRQR